MLNSIKRMQNENITVNVYTSYYILHRHLAEHCAQEGKRFEYIIAI